MSNSLRTVLEKVLLSGKLKKQYIDCLLTGKNFELYKQAFTHKTHNAETNYEFFEQLGDLSINKFIVSYTYKRFPHLKTPQGVKIVARVRIKYTSRETLSQEAEKLGFWPFILASENTKFRFKKDLLEDCFESFIGVTEYILDTQLKDGVGYCIVKDILTPGWCYIRHNKNNIQYKYGPQIVKENNKEKENMKLGRILFNYRIAREQYERDMDVERLGDLSEFYGEPTLEEIYENDIENDGENISYESSSSDSDYY